jgi:hypothetical protein
LVAQFRKSQEKFNKRNNLSKLDAFFFYSPKSCFNNFNGKKWAKEWKIFFDVPISMESNDEGKGFDFGGPRGVLNAI